MAQREILIHPDARLRIPSKPVEIFDADLARLVDDLAEGLAAHAAIGLSAPQINDHRRVMVIDPDAKGECHVYVNPVIHQRSAWGLVEESCLSVPGVKGSIIRATKITLSAQDATGAPIAKEVSGMHAVCVQHEVDHLDGKLFIDRFSPIGRLRMRRRFGRARTAPAG